MKSIKPGRGPSKLNFAGSVIAVLFGLLWTVLTFSMTRGTGLIGIIFPLFGLLFIAVGVVQAVVSYQNATGSEEERMSLYDVVETSDSEHGAPRPAQDANRYCPYCGEPLKQAYTFCPRCGRSQSD